ncbi:MAG: OmpA family protein, partial [Elusimicrobiota bacterium]
GLTDEKKAEDELKSKFTNIEITEEMIKITLPSPVLFDSGKAELKPAAMTALKDIANTIKNMSNRLLIEGHTDNKPVHSKKFQSNWELSTARAFSVIRYFIENEKLDPRRLSAVGYGEFRPKDSNETEEGRAVNRRIEIYIAKLK